MDFFHHQLRTLRDAAIWDLPQQMAVISRPDPEVIIFPHYFLLVEEGKIIRKIDELPHLEAVLGGLKEAVQKHLPLRDPEDRMEVAYDGVCRVFTSNSARQVAHWLCLPSYTGKYSEQVGNELTIRKEWHWPPDLDKLCAEILIYPAPCSFDTVTVQERWLDKRTLEIQIKVPHNDNYLVIFIVNDVLQNIAWLTLPCDEE